MNAKQKLLGMALLAMPFTVSAQTDLIQNGDFSGFLGGWTQPVDLINSGMYEHDSPDGYAYFNTDNGAYVGTLLRQNLNVPAVAGIMVSFSFDLKAQWEQDGNSIAVYLEYSKANGNIEKSLVLSPGNADISTTVFTPFSANFTFPGDADRLLGITIDRLGFGPYYADNISLISPVPGEPLPKLSTVSLSRVAYGSDVTITGENFGAAQGMVLLNGNAAGITINTWSETAIEISVDDPAAGGYVTIVRSDKTQTSETNYLEVSSPHFTATRFWEPDDFGGGDPKSGIALAGQTVYVTVDVDCFNGCLPAGGITFSVPEAPGAMISPTMIAEDGGSRIGIDTSGLAPGLHSFTVQSSAAGFLPRTFSVEIDVRASGTFELSYWNQSAGEYQPIPDPLALTVQGDIDMQLTLQDAGGNDLTPYVDLTLSSNNPAVVNVYNSESPWESSAILAQDSGSCTISVHGPSGVLGSFPVTVTVPNDPKMLACSFYPTTITNSGTETTNLTTTTSQPMTRHNFGTSSDGLSIIDHVWSNGNATITNTLQVVEAASPGAAKWTSSGTLADGSVVSRSQFVYIVNDPATGLIRGNLALMHDPFHSHGANGTVEFYDAASGVKVFERMLFEFSWNYAIAAIPPGNYKIRWSTGTGGGYPAPQWYGNAYDISGAEVVSITAGSVLSNVNFFLDRLPGSLEPLPEISSPTYSAANNQFQFSIPTSDGFVYDLMKSFTGKDGSWFRVGTVYGSGSNSMVSDDSAIEPNALYKIVRR